MKGCLLSQEATRRGIYDIRFSFELYVFLRDHRGTALLNRLSAFSQGNKVIDYESKEERTFQAKFVSFALIS